LNHSSTVRPFGFNVFGYVTANVGVGVITRDVIRLILQKGYPVAAFDVDPNRGGKQHDTRYSSLTVRTIDELPYGINLFILSITSLPDLLLSGKLTLRDTVLQVGYFWWELPVIPPMWVKSLEQFDVLVAGSQYLRSVFERHVVGKPIVLARHGLRTTQVHPDRPKFNLPSDKVIYIGIVEPTSDSSRKNPLASVAAFERAFPNDDKAHLVIKINNATVDREGRELLAQLQEAIGRLDGRATVFKAILSYEDVLQLYASCDVFIGLHRAEGLGLGLMEAMSLAKPVIATGWSGNTTFMDHTNSCLVGYSFIPVSGNLTVYSQEFLKEPTHWADPDLDEAAAWMKALATDSNLRTSIGLNAFEAMQRYCAEAERGIFLEELRAIWERRRFFSGTQTRSAATVRILREARFDHYAGSFHRVFRKAVAVLEKHVLWRFRSK
jgi:glycosyltransferase involved in cell wall biosynthesis